MLGPLLLFATAVLLELSNQATLAEVVSHIQGDLRFFPIFWFPFSFDLGITKTNKQRNPNSSPNSKTALNNTC